MSAKVNILNCPACGAGLEVSQKVCEYCQNPVVISTFNSVESLTGLQLMKYSKSYSNALESDPNNAEINNAIAMVYLKLKMYDKANSAFEKAFDDNLDNSETFFYAGVSLLQGKKAFVQLRPTIDKILEYINVALMIEPKGIYYYFLAYIKYDYFKRKFFKTSPTFEEALGSAKSAGVSGYDIAQLFSIMGVERPECL